MSSTPPVGSVWAPETLIVDGVSFTTCKFRTVSLRFTDSFTYTRALFM